MTTSSREGVPAPTPPAAAAESVEGITSVVLRYRTPIAVVVAVLGVLVIWLVARGNGGSDTTKPAPTAATPAQLRSLAASVGHPIFWLGPQRGTTYELAQAKNGSIYIRYLPAGVSVGDGGSYLTVVTYPYQGAYDAVKGAAQLKGDTSRPLRGGGIAETSAPPATSTNVHVAYPGVDLQAEIYDPVPGEAYRDVKRGRLKAFGQLNLRAVSAVTPKDLHALAGKLGHPLYWVGRKPGYTYELTQTTDGQVQVRYLPRGVNVGSPDPYLTVGTYPVAGAFQAVHRLAQSSSAETIHLSGGGLAVVSSTTPESIHLAYPGSAFQIEVYDPSPAKAKRVVSSNQLKTIP